MHLKIDWGNIMKELLTKFTLLIAYFVLSWGCVCGLVKLITLGYDWEFTFPHATGVWLIMILVRITFNFNGGN